MQGLRLWVLGLLWVSQLSFAAAQPITLTIRNNSSLDVQLDPSKTQASNIDLDDLKKLQQQIILGKSVQTFTFRTTGEPVSLFLAFRSTTTDPTRAGLDVAQWEYGESPEGVIGCHNLRSNQSFDLVCNSNDSLLQPQIGLTLNDSKSYSVTNVGPLTINIINETDVDLTITPDKSKNISAYDLQDITGQEVYAKSQHTMLLSRDAYPAHMYLIFNTSQAEGAQSSRTIGEWEYVEEDQISEPCHRFIPIYPYSMTCYGVTDIANPEVFITVTKHNTQSFPKAN